MYKLYSKFYYNLGIRKASDFVSPKIVKFKDHSLPYYTIVHYPNVNKEYPSKAMGVLANIKTGYITNIFKYKVPKYNVKYRAFNENTLVNNFNKTHKSIITLSSIKLDNYFKSKIKKLRDEVICYNYEFINNYSIYKEDKYNEYYKFVNKYNTIFNIINELNEFNIKKEHINNFLILTLDSTTYGLSIIKKYIKSDLSSKFLELFYNDKKLILLELYKFITEDTHKDSLFYKLRNNENITLILSYKNNSILLNLNKLLSFCKFSSLESDMKFDDNTMLNNLFNIVHTLINISEYDDIIDIKKGMVTADEKENLIDMKNFLKTLKDDDSVLDDEVTIIKDKKENIVNNDINVIEEVGYVNKYENINEDDISNETDSVKTILTNIDDDLNNNNIDKKKKKKLSEMVIKFNNSKSPFDDKVTIKDYINIKESDLELPDSIIKVNLKTVTNKDIINDTNNFITKTYINKVLKKDIISTYINLQKTGLIIKNITVEKHDDILGAYELHKITVSDKGKSNYTINLRIPTIYEDGTFKLSGNNYILKKQRIQKPIVKIKHNKVMLTSAYGKVAIVKAPMKKYDIGYKIRRELVKYNNDDIISNLMFGTFNFEDTKLPDSYYTFARYIKSFKFKSYKFFFILNNRQTLTKIKLEDIEKDKYVLIGTKGNDLLMLGFDDVVYIYKDKKYTPIDKIVNILEIDSSKLFEYSFMNIFKLTIPTVFILSYYLGLTNLLKLLKVNYEILDGNKRVNIENGIVVKFSDKTLLIKYDNVKQKIILNGLLDKEKVLRGIPFNILNNKLMFMNLFKEYGLNITATTEIKVLEDMFIDTVTKSVLLDMKEPTTFIGLLIRASELLISDKYTDSSGIDKYIIKGYEKIPQFIHNTFVKAIKKKTGEEHFGRSKLVVDPFSIVKLLNEDSASELVDDTNPMSLTKQKTDVTFLGSLGGLNKETMTAPTRIYNEKDIGIISEAVKDNSDVGLTAYLSANPLLKNLRGISDNNIDTKKMDWSNIMSDNSMVSPFILTDDPKRVVYSNIQASHVIPLKNPKTFPVRTIYQSVYPYKCDRKFVDFAKEEGVVTSVKDKSIVISYKTLGKVGYEFNDWSSKEEAGTTYKHVMISNLKVKDKVKFGDVIYYDKGFFEIDMFDNTKVIYRTGTYTTVAMVEAENTYEDSFVLTDRLSKDTTSTIIKIKDIILKFDENISNVIKVNETVNAYTPLFTISNTLEGDKNLSDETMDLLQGFVKTTPKAGYEGKISKIMVYYNGEIKDMSNSLKKLIKDTEKYMVDKVSGKVYKGKVDGSYSLNGKPLDKNSLHIKIYIDTDNNMGTGDKAILSNQLKTTVTNIMDFDEFDENGDKIDIKFSYTSVYNRIVKSSDLMGTTGMVLKIGTDEVVKMFFK